MLNTLWGVLRYEYRMAIRRRSILVVCLLIGLLLVSSSDSSFPPEQFTSAWIEADAGQLAFGLNIFFPVIAGILSADRAVRDEKLRVRELLRASQLQNWVYVLGKYLGVALAMLTVQWVLVLAVNSLRAAIYGIPLAVIPTGLAASALINFPALLFVIAFSLACPLIMPLRVYQILFTGYWYWGNFLNPELFPSISDTLLNASGRYAQAAFFGGSFGRSGTPEEALLNILILMAGAAGALVGLWALLQSRDGQWRRNS